MTVAEGDGILRGHRCLSESCDAVERMRLVSGAVLCGHGAEGECNTSPLVLPGGTARQMHDDAPHGALDTSAEFEQPLAQRRYLRTRQAGSDRTAAQLLHEHVSSGGQKDPELIGQKARAAGAVDLQPVVQLSR